jgi:hypothetical protein
MLAKHDAGDDQRVDRIGLTLVASVPTAKSRELRWYVNNEEAGVLQSKRPLAAKTARAFDSDTAGIKLASPLLSSSYPSW